MTLYESKPIHGLTAGHSLDHQGILPSLKGEENWLVISDDTGVIGCSKEPLAGSNTPESCQKLSEGQQICDYANYTFTEVVTEVSSELFCNLIDILCQQVGLCEESVCPSSEACEIPEEGSYLCESEPPVSEYSCQEISEGKQLCSAQAPSCLPLNGGTYLCRKTPATKINISKYQKKKNRKKRKKKGNRKKNKSFRKNPRYLIDIYLC